MTPRPAFTPKTIQRPDTAAALRSIIADAELALRRQEFSVVLMESIRDTAEDALSDLEE